MKKIYSILTIVCLGLGILLGFLAPEFSKSIAFLGTYYVNALKILIGPVLFFAIAVSMVSHKKGDGKIVVKTVILFILMFIATFLLTSLIVSLIKPGVGFLYETKGDPSSEADFSILSILKHLLPSDVKSFFMGGSIFFIIVLSFVVSLIFCLIKPLKNTYGNVCSFVKKILDIILKVVIYLTPIAVVSLVSNLIVKNGDGSLTMGLVYILMAWGCCVLALLVIMILPVWLIAKVNPIQYIKKVSKIWLVSISTQSSVATLPHTIKVCNEDFGIDEKITNIVVPLGCTIHMCGGAVSFSLLGLFVAQLNGITVTLSLYLLMILSATLINMAAPGIPGGGKVIGFSYLSLLGLPITDFYGFYVAIYPFLDMAYTTLNVTGDISANILLNKKND